MYDSNGNRTYSLVYASDNDTNPTTTSVCAYAASGWRDQLVARDEVLVEHDEFGNPKNWGGASLTWAGRTLIAFDNVAFTYNDSGVRITKSVGDDTTTYTVDGTRILKEVRANGDVLIYLYGKDGILGFTYNGTEYYYGKNLFGDISDIYDATGTKVAHYVYDAWGNHDVYDGQGNAKTDSAFIGNINPFRYRGYYFDTETGFYYLQSRYYDPVAGRFLNADSLAYLGADGELRGYNLYTYCGNNPVMNVDPSGHSALAIIGVVAIILGLAATAHDIYQIANKNVYVDMEKTNDKNVRITNSYMILTPWVKFYYSVYLTYFNPDTKDVLQGTPYGVYYEWELHNCAAWLGFGDSAEHVDLGRSIFADLEVHPLINKEGEIDITGIMSIAMIFTYMLFFPPRVWIWDLIAYGGF